MPPTEEDLAWFRSTFRPIPKAQLPDDCVEYSLYIFYSDVSFENDAKIRERLREVQKYSSSLQKEFLKDYIWQREGFGLEITKEDGVTLLRGRSNYGDSVEDEWVIVWLLRELTKKFDDLAVKVKDNDGEFLLIEAAAQLPEWLEPEVAENRVWIYRGGLLILKPSSGKSTSKTLKKVSVQVARDSVLNQQKLHLRSSLIEKEAFHRLRNYPAQISQNMHHALATLPRKVAFLLHQKPTYVAPAIEAFYLRDPIALKPLQTKGMKSNLTFSPQDFVTVSIRFPRAAYAQLKSQDFPTPANWTGSLPSTDNLDATEQAKTGMKLSCGMEMLLSDPQNQDKPAVREIKMLLSDLDSGDDSLPSDKDITSWPRLQDDEAWLDISFEDLEDELAPKDPNDNQKKSAPNTKRGQFGDTQAQENLQRIVSQFEAFLKDDVAGPDGTGLFEEDTDDESDADPDAAEVEDESDEEEDQDLVGLDNEKLSAMMKQMMGFSMTDHHDPTSRMRPKPWKHVEGDRQAASQTGVEAGPSRGRVRELASDDEEGKDDDDEVTAADLTALSAQMEAELRGHGALDLGPDPIPIPIPSSDSQLAPQNPVKGQGKAKARADEPSGVELRGQDGELDIEANLAKNLLESLKSQAGAPGPGGNLMGLMGGKMPRDEGDEAREEGKQ